MQRPGGFYESHKVGTVSAEVIQDGGKLRDHVALGRSVATLGSPAESRYPLKIRYFW